MAVTSEPLGEFPPQCLFAEMAAAERMGFLDLRSFAQREIDAYRVHTVDCVYCLFYREQADAFDAERACNSKKTA